MVRAIEEPDQSGISPEADLVRKAQAYLRSRDLAERPAAAECEAWQRFYDRYSPLVSHFVRRHVNDNAFAEDCEQEVWLTLLRRLQHFHFDPSRGRFRSWLYTVVHGVTVDQIRRRRHDAPPLDHAHFVVPAVSAAGESEALVAEAEAALAVARNHISAENFRIVWMRCVDGAPASDVAAALGLTERQVWFRLHRARKKLRRLWGERAWPAEGASVRARPHGGRLAAAADPAAAGTSSP